MVHTVEQVWTGSDMDEANVDGSPDVDEAGGAGAWWEGMAHQESGPFQGSHAGRTCLICFSTCCLDLSVRLGVGRPVLGRSAIQMGAMECPGIGHGHRRPTEGVQGERGRTGVRVV